MASQLEGWIDVDVVGGAGDGSSLANAESSMSAFESGEQGNLVISDEYYDVYCYATSGGNDTTSCSWSGWTTGLGNDLRITCPQRTTAHYNWVDSIYTMVISNADCITIAVNYISFTGLQVELDSGDSTNDEIFICASITNAGTCSISRCYARAGAASVCTCYSFQDADMTFTLSSSVGVATSTGRDTYFVAGTGYIYHNVLTGGASGFRSGTSGTYTVTNNALFNTADDYITGAGSTVTIDHNASDDGDGTNAVAPSGGNWANEFEDYANGDFRVKNTGNLYHAGADLAITTDYRGNTFHATTPSIGAFEYQATASKIPLFMAHYRRRWVA